MSASPQLSRRAWLRGAWLRAEPAPAPTPGPAPTEPDNARAREEAAATARAPRPHPLLSRVAAPDGASLAGVPVFIHALDCLASASLTCTTCLERCPVPGALVASDGAPRIDPAVCTRCGICHDVCPAPTNAVRATPRWRAPRGGGA